MKRTHIHWLGILVMLILASSCKKETASQLPTVTTGDVTSVTSTSAVAGGTVVTEGSSPVTARGVCWNTSTAPTVNNSKTTDNASPFVSSLNGLAGYTVYYVRAYATSKEGTAYGNEVSFTTLPGSVKIGSQTWMDRNLNVSTYRNGDPILNVTSATEWSNLTKSAYADYDNSTSNSNTFGRLYNFYAVTDSRNLCPAGYHVPSDTEWTTLTDFLGGLAVAGGKLKETGTVHWQADNVAATNESGFTALPGGHRYNDGVFANMGIANYLWTSTSTSASNASYRILNKNGPGVATGDVAKVLGCSVRCVKD